MTNEPCANSRTNDAPGNQQNSRPLNTSNADVLFFVSLPMADKTLAKHDFTLRFATDDWPLTLIRNLCQPECTAESDATDMQSKSDKLLINLPVTAAEKRQMVLAQEVWGGVQLEKMGSWLSGSASEAEHTSYLRN